MALFQLATHHSGLGCYINEILSHEIIEIPFDHKSSQTSEAILLRTSDSVILRHLEFHPTNDMDVNNFKLLMKDCYIEIIANGHTFINYNLGLCMELENVRKINNAFIVTIPFSYTIGKLYLIAMQHCPIKIRVSGPNQDQMYNIKMFSDSIYLDSAPRRSIFANPQSLHIQEFNIIGKCCPYDVQYGVAKINLLPHVQAKGYFIEGEISKIEKILLTSNNGQIILVYDKDSDNNMYKMISPMLCFISNANVDYKLMEYSEQFNNSKITIKFTNLENQIISSMTIYVLFQKKMEYVNGVVKKINY